MTRTPAGVAHGRSRAPALRIEDLSVSYRDVVALEQVTLEVPRGGACGLVGMNGSGK